MDYIKYHYRRTDNLTSMKIGTAECIAHAIFHFCDECQELLLVSSNSISDLGKVAAFLVGDKLNQDDVENLREVTPNFVPLAVLVKYFIVEKIDGIDFRKLLSY